MIHTPYVMHDQVRDLVPHLMSHHAKPHRLRGAARFRSWLEIGVFVAATLSYVAALAIVA